MGRVVGIIGCLVLGSSAPGQSLFTAEKPGDGVSAPAARGEPAAEVYAMSMVAIRPPDPREYRVHDLISIVIDEQSKSTSNQKLETDKEANAKLQLNGIIDPWELLETRIRQGALSGVDLLNAKNKRDFTGEGDYERTDRFTARITAEVIDIKPNGTIVLEAKKRIVRDAEETELVLSGVARPEDVTLQNTVLSSQLANLRLEQHNTGDVPTAATKGLLTNILDTIFNF